MNLNELSTTTLLFQCLMSQVEKLFHSYENDRSHFFIQTERNHERFNRKKDERGNMDSRNKKVCFFFFGFYVVIILVPQVRFTKMCSKSVLALLSIRSY